MTNDINSVALRQVLEAIVNKPCWGVIAGPGTGSHISLDFGGKQPRERPLKNPHLTDDQQRFEGEYVLYVTCTWRLQLRDRVICSSTSSNAKDGPLQKGLGRLVDDIVNQVSVGPPAFDVEIRFQSGLVLLVFCDISNDEDEDNYSIFCPQGILTVSGGSEQIMHEARP